MSSYDDPRWYEEQDTDKMKRLSPDANNQASFNVAHAPEDDDVYPQRQRQQLPSPPQPKQYGHLVRPILSVIVLVVIAFFAGWFSHEFFGNNFTQSDSSRANAQLIQQAWDIIDQHYVDRKAVNYKNMAYSAITSMVTSLGDTGHTRFLTPQQVQSENQQLSGTYKGYGLYLAYDSQRKLVIISSTIPGSPAQKAGFRRGDAIIAIDGQDVKGKMVSDISTILGAKTSTTAITVERTGSAQPITIKVDKAVINVQNVVMHYIPESHIADIQIVQFADGETDQLKSALTEAKKLGATKIILDLRDNPGGYLQAAIDTASDFVPKGNVLLEQDSSGQRTPVPVSGQTIDTTSSIVILTNNNTASAAEIVTGSLHDNHRAYVIGEKTFGTGTVLQQYNLTDGSAILLGTQEWLTPDGKFIRGNGITPDKIVALASNQTELTPNDENAANMTQEQILAAGDGQLNAAIQYLNTH